MKASSRVLFINAIAIFITLSQAYADMPSDTNVLRPELREIPSDVLVGCIGILSAHTTVCKTSPIRIYGKYKESRKERAKELDIYEATVGIYRSLYPINIYHSGLSKKEKEECGELPINSQNADYPIVRKRGNWLEIVYDVISNKRGWVNIDERDRGIEYNAYLFSDLESMKKTQLDIFTLFEGRERKVFDSPSGRGEYKVLSLDIDDQHHPMFAHKGPIHVIDVKKDFLKIVMYDYFSNKGPDAIGVEGWIRIRDERERITICLDHSCHQYD